MDIKRLCTFFLLWNGLSLKKKNEMVSLTFLFYKRLRFCHAVFLWVCWVIVGFVAIQWAGLYYGNDFCISVMKYIDLSCIKVAALARDRHSMRLFYSSLTVRMYQILIYLILCFERTELSSITQEKKQAFEISQKKCVFFFVFFSQCWSDSFSDPWLLGWEPLL